MAFSGAVEIPADAYRCEPIDSYAEFTKDRPVLAEVCKKQPRVAGAALNETIDPSLLTRLDESGFLDSAPVLREQLRALPVGT